MAACQIVLKGTIIKTIADGTLYTRDWDIEPLFPLPDTDAVNNNIENKGQHVLRLEKIDSECSCHGYWKHKLHSVLTGVEWILSD